MKEKKNKILKRIKVLGGIVGTDLLLAETLFFLVTSRKSPIKTTFIRKEFGLDTEETLGMSGITLSSNFILSNSKSIYIMSDDNIRLHAYYIKNNSNKYVVICPGYKSEGKYSSQRAKHFYDLGYNVFALDLRGTGKSSGQYYGFGWTEKRDVVSWCKFIKDFDQKASIALFGTSMGGATVMMASGEEDLPKEVKCIIEDCGYSSIWNEFAYQFEKKHIPTFPVLDTLDLIAQKKLNISLKKASAVEQVRKTKVPILFIHGSKDNFVPLYMLYELYDSCNSCYKEKLIIEGAKHSVSDVVNPKLYWDTILRFVNKFI